MKENPVFQTTQAKLQFWSLILKPGLIRGENIYGKLGEIIYVLGYKLSCSYIFPLVKIWTF